MKYGFYALAFALLLTSCVKEENMAVVRPEDAQQKIEPLSEGIYVPGELNVKFSEELTLMLEEDLADGGLQTKSSELNAIFDELGVVSVKRLVNHGGEYEPRMRREGLHRWYKVTLSEQEAHTKAVTTLSHVTGVEIAEPVRRMVRKDYTGYNDPYLTALWGFDNGQYDINVKPVWQNYTTGNPNVIVAIMDGGVDINHEDLKDNCIERDKHINTTGSASVDAEVHGTHVAGTVAAVSNNGKGVAGVAGGDYAAGQKGVTIMACQILSEQPNRSGDYTNAMVHACNNGAVISQNSWGYSFDSNNDGVLTGGELTNALAAEITQYDKAAVDYFIKYAGTDNDGNQRSDSPMKGGLVIFAAGNDAIENGAPANYDAVIAVGAMGPYGGRTSFSCYGDWVDVCAPGQQIMSTTPAGYEYLDGTSMACPHVSGVAALVLSYCGGQGFTNEMLWDKIVNTANTEAVPLSYKIGGLVDAHKALEYGRDVDPAEIKDLEVEAVSNNIDFSVTVTADGEGVAAYGYKVLYDTDRAKVEAATFSSTTVKSFSFVPELAIGETAEFRVEGLEFSTPYYLKVYSYTYGMNFSEPTEIYEVLTGENNPPEVSVEEGSTEFSAADVAEIRLDIVDPDGHKLTVEHTPGSAADKLVEKSSGYYLEITANAAPEGTYTAKIKVTDAYGISAETSYTYTILSNEAPEVIAEVEDILLSAKGKEFVLDMSEYVSDDQDVATLTYETVISNPAVLHIVPRENTLYGTALGYGSTDVSIIVKDARGESCQLDFKVVVKNPSEPVSLYPNPVKDYLNVSTMDLKDTRVRIVSQTGQAVYDKVSEIGAFAPAKIDMRGCAPGVYSVSVTIDGKETRQNIVKL